MKMFLEALLVILIGSTPGGAKQQDQILQQDPFTTIAKHRITEKQLAVAIAKLTLPAKEPSNYWGRMANDSTYPVFHRRCAAMQLFKRHARAGMPLVELSKLLDHPKWLRNNDVHEVTTVIGHIPVEFNFKDTVFTIDFLRTEHSYAVVYLRMTGKVEQRGFRRLLTGEADEKRAPDLTKAKIAERGFVELNCCSSGAFSTQGNGAIRGLGRNGTKNAHKPPTKSCFILAF